MTQATCMYCGELLRLDPSGLGWLHPDGGAYMMKCDGCGWHGAPYPSPVRCPACGNELRDDHVARPRALEVAD